MVPGVPLYVADPNAPGGWIINKVAFIIPASGQDHLGRNALRGFDAIQIDFVLRRLFALSERVRLRSSADSSTFNHPGFGGPRSVQLALRLEF